MERRHSFMVGLTLLLESFMMTNNISIDEFLAGVTTLWGTYFIIRSVIKK